MAGAVFFSSLLFCLCLAVAQTLLFLPLLFPFVAATTKKIAVWNMIGDDMKVQIWSATAQDFEIHEEVQGRISCSSIKPHIFDISSVIDSQEKPPVLKVLRINKASKDVVKEVTLPLFSDRSLHTFQKFFKNIPSQPHTLNGITSSPQLRRLLEEEFSKFDALFYHNQKDTLVELVPVWKITPSIAEFAVYLLYPNGSVFASPLSHEEIKIDFYNDKFDLIGKKRKIETEEDLQKKCKAKTTHINHKDRGSKIGTIENIKIGVINKVNDDLRVEIKSGGESSWSPKIDKDDNTLKIYDISFDKTKSACNDEQILSVILLDGDKAVFDASMPILNGLDLNTLRELLPSHGKERYEPIFVWTFYDNGNDNDDGDDDGRAEFEIYWLHLDGSSTKIMSIAETTFIWDPIDDEEVADWE